MPDPISIDIPHQLGLAGARARLDGGVSKVGTLFPGGALKQHRWEGDTLFFTVEAMGQRLASKIEVYEARVHATVDMPQLGSLLTPIIKDRLRDISTRLLR